MRSEITGSIHAVLFQGGEEPLSYPALKFRPAGEGSHGKCEWATVESILKVAKAIERATEEFCRS